MLGRCSSNVLMCVGLFGIAPASPVDVSAATVDEGRRLLAEANAAEDTRAGLELARRAVALLEQAEASSDRDALLMPAVQFVEALTMFAGRESGEGLSGEIRQRMVTQFEAISPEHPLYARAGIHLGRYFYWLGRQNGDVADYERSREYFERGREFQNERLFRMYAGERLVWPTQYDGGAENAPAWAAKQREALCRAIEVIHYWVNNRQATNGSLGGGWGDDVEILRFWPVAILAADDELARVGMRRLVEGVWASEAIDRQRGFASRLTDVEHAAELTADSQPMMILYDYGSPRYVDRNMRSMKLAAEQWTGRNDRGRRLFRSSWFSADRIDTTAGRDVCSPYCVRAVQAGHWLGWYGRYPEVTKFFTEWMDTWVAAIESNARGKPAGVPPASIRFHDEQFGGAGPTWYDSGLGKLYTFPAALGLLYEQLLTTYALSGDEKYVLPIFEAVDLVQSVASTDAGAEAEPGTREWAAARMRPAVVSALSKWRMMTNDSRFDAYLRREGRPYIRYRLTGDSTPLVEACDRSIASTRFNREFVTSEVRWTDRVAVQETDTLLAMYTGHAGHAGYWPMHAVTWEETGPHFAALVSGADDNSVEVQAYSFAPQPKQVRMRLWRLAAPGKYRVSLYDGERRDQERIESWTLRWERRGDAATVTLPARRLVTLVVEPIEHEPPNGARFATDVAISADDLALESVNGRPRTLQVTVFNLSAMPARNVKVTLGYVTVPGQTRTMHQVSLPQPLAGLRDFTPGSQRVTLQAPGSLGLYELSVESADPELNPMNNTVKLMTGRDLSLQPVP